MARMTSKKAATARKSWVERAETWRDKIRVAQIINRLQDFAEGKEGVEMTPAQVKAAQVLLDRAMPTLSASEITRVNEIVNPQELLDRLKDAVGEDAFAKLSKDYTPEVTEDAIRH